VDSIYFEVKTIFARLEMVDGFRGRSWLLLESSADNRTFCYDAMMPDNLPCCIVDDKLIFKNGCVSKISGIKEGIICFDCSEDGCFLYEYNPLDTE
jgi:hypothetical protein